MTSEELVLEQNAVKCPYCGNMFVPATGCLCRVKSALNTPLQRNITKAVERLKSLPQVDLPLKHHFAPHMYAREIFMPKGSLVISKVHKTCHLHVIVKGKLSVWIEGIGVKTFEAPFVGVTYPGTRRIIYNHEDVIFITFHPTEKTKIEEIEKDCVYEPTDANLEVDSSIVESLTNAR